MITSCAPVASPVPAAASPPTMGYRLGTTRTAHPVVSGPPSPVRQVSGGVWASWPGQNGQCSGPLRVVVSARAVGGRAARSAAMIARRSRMGSWRYSGIGSRLGAVSVRPVTRRLVIIGGGPAGKTAATVAATLGAQVTLIERDVIGGAAHLLDCVP